MRKYCTSNALNVGNSAVTFNYGSTFSGISKKEAYFRFLKART